jgi:hypothetical protein
MLFIFSATVLIRHLWQLKTVVFLHYCLIHAVLLKISFLDAAERQQQQQQLKVFNYIKKYAIYLFWAALEAYF